MNGEVNIGRKGRTLKMLLGYKLLIIDEFKLECNFKELKSDYFLFVLSHETY